MKIIKQIVAQIQEDIESDIFGINWGGCGTFAYHMCKTLQQKGYDAKIIIISGDECSYDRKRTMLDWYKKGDRDISGLHKVSFVHCFLRVGDFDFDGVHSGIDDIKDDFSRWSYKYGGEYSLEDMQIALKVGQWNSDYSRSQDKRLKEIIKTNTLTLKQVS